MAHCVTSTQGLCGVADGSSIASLRCFSRSNPSGCLIVAARGYAALETLCSQLDSVWLIPIVMVMLQANNLLSLKPTLAKKLNDKIKTLQAEIEVLRSDTKVNELERKIHVR